MRLIEQEVCVTMNAEESHAVVWTCWPPMIRKMEKAGIPIYRKDGEYGRCYHVPKKWIKISKGRLGMKRGPMTEEQKARMRENLARVRKP